MSTKRYDLNEVLRQHNEGRRIVEGSDTPDVTVADWMTPTRSYGADSRYYIDPTLVMALLESTGLLDTVLHSAGISIETFTTTPDLMRIDDGCVVVRVGDRLCGALPLAEWRRRLSMAGGVTWPPLTNPEQPTEIPPSWERAREAWQAMRSAYRETPPQQHSDDLFNTVYMVKACIYRGERGLVDAAEDTHKTIDALEIAAKNALLWEKPTKNTASHSKEFTPFARTIMNLRLMTPVGAPQQTKRVKRGNCPKCSYRARLRSDGTVGMHVIYVVVPGQRDPQPQHCHGAGSAPVGDVK